MNLSIIIFFVIVLLFFSITLVSNSAAAYSTYSKLPPAFYSAQEPHSVLNPLLAHSLFILTTLSMYVAYTCPLCLVCHFIKVGIILTTHGLLYTLPIPACTHCISECAPLLSQCGPYHSTCTYVYEKQCSLFHLAEGRQQLRTVHASLEMTHAVCSASCKSSIVMSW